MAHWAHEVHPCHKTATPATGIPPQAQHTHYILYIGLFWQLEGEMHAAVSCRFKKESAKANQVHADDEVLRFVRETVDIDSRTTSIVREYDTHGIDRLQLFTVIAKADILPFKNPQPKPHRNLL